MSTLFHLVRPRGAPGRPEPGATTNGSGRLPPVAERRRAPRGEPARSVRSGSSRVVVVAADPATATRHATERYGRDGVPAREVILVTDRASMARLDGLSLRRTDRVEWVQGWYRGPAGPSFAAMLEGCAAVGAFGTARHVFTADDQ